MRKVWFDEERPHQREARLAHEAEVERMRIEQEKAAKRREEQAIREAEWKKRVADEDYAIARKQSLKQARKLDTLDAILLHYANHFPILNAGSTYNYPTELDRFSLDGRVDRVLVQPAGWMFRTPPQFRMVLLGRTFGFPKSGFREDNCLLMLIKPEQRRNAEIPGRSFEYGQTGTQSRSMRAGDILIAPPEASRVLIQKLPPLLSSIVGSIGYIPKRDAINEFEVDDDKVTALCRDNIMPDWSAPWHQFGLRKHFGAFEDRW